MSLHKNERDFLASPRVFLPWQKQSVYEDDEYWVRLEIIISLCYIFVLHPFVLLRTLRLQEAGLINEWYKRYVPSASKCMKVNERNNKPRLSIKHLSSPFVILATGYLLSLISILRRKTYSFLLGLACWSFN